MLISVLLIIATLLVALLFLRLRFRFELSPQYRRLFVGLGRSGVELDLKNNERLLKFMGLSVSRSPMNRRTTRPTAKPIRSRSPRRSSWRDLRDHLPQILRALFTFLRSLWKSTRIERCEGELHGGFAAPDITGQMFGFYQAVAGAIPGGSRFRFVPSWFETPFTGQVQLVVATPLYALVYRSLVLIIQLPKRALLRAAFRNKKKGTHNG